ncbi:NAD(P)H-binding protein [Bacteriovorax sp. DB6_IX]|uniref:NmrA family NAD(P)-binding protein n=1 Tax=Bacteriovorax sp. DB6_IX TaxID=1353530 RepID=UPI00038A383B|nr:NAD(P)H-binding protein [Bacteriovorax sp. DB6_IX]EQC51301.1 NAD(P)H-binding protein, PF13460 family [Bacteriovorax sp. DB6_IX]
MSKENILILGASGTVGSEIARQLTSEGHNVLRATSKDKLAADQVKLNLATGEGVKEAFSNIDRVFLISPPGYANQYDIISPLIQEAKRKGLKKVVLMTAMGANADENSPFRRAEVELEKSGLNYNIVRPNWFFQNFNTFWIQGINEHRKILLPVGEAKVSFIDARDISAVIAKLLVDDSFNNTDFDITGPSAIDHSEVAKAISLQIGEEVLYQEIQPQQLREGLLAAGLPEDYSDFLLLILGFLKEGYNAGLTDNVEKILGRKPLSLTDYVRDYKEAWKAN